MVCASPPSKIWKLIPEPLILLLLRPVSVPVLRVVRLALLFAGASSVSQNIGISPANPANAGLFWFNSCAVFVSVFKTNKSNVDWFLALSDCKDFFKFLIVNCY